MSEQGRLAGPTPTSRRAGCVAHKSGSVRGGGGQPPPPTRPDRTVRLTGLLADCLTHTPDSLIFARQRCPQSVDGTNQIAVKHRNVLNFDPEPAELLFNRNQISTCKLGPDQPLDDALDLGALRMEVGQINGNCAVGFRDLDIDPLDKAFDAFLDSQEVSRSSLVGGRCFELAWCGCSGGGVLRWTGRACRLRADMSRRRRRGC